MAQLLSVEEACWSSVGAVLNLFIGWGDAPDAARQSLLEARRRAGIGSPT